MACAEQIKSMLLHNHNRAEETQRRIRNSSAVEKFLDPTILEFDPGDIEYCIKPLPPEFVMLVTHHNIPTIQKVLL